MQDVVIEVHKGIVTGIYSEAENIRLSWSTWIVWIMLEQAEAQLR